MNVYFSVLFFVVLVCLYPARSENGKRNKLLLALLPIFLMCGFHGDWSGDYSSYLDAYKYFNSLNFKDLPLRHEHIEVGFQYLLFFLPSHLSLLLVHSFWICLFLYVLFTKFIPEKYWSVAFVVIFLNQQMLMGDISGIRNGMAVFFFIIAISFLCRVPYLKNNRVWYLLFIILGGLIHTSCFFMAVFMFLSKKQASQESLNRTILLFAFFFVVTMVTPHSVIDAVDFFVNNIFIFDRYSNYLADVSDVKAAWGISRLFVFYVAVISMIELRKPGYSETDYVMIRFAFVWSVMMLIPGTIAVRFFFYVNYLMLVGMMIIAFKSKNKAIRWGNVLSLLIYYIYNFRVFSHTEWFAERWQNYTLYFQ